MLIFDCVFLFFFFFFFWGGGGGRRGAEVILTVCLLLSKGSVVYSGEGGYEIQKQWIQTFMGLPLEIG